MKDSPRQSHIRLMKDRRYELVPLDQIEVLNSRNRDEEQFAQNVRSIKDLGLLKPVVLNERYRKQTGKYQLVCGEGRFIAHKRLGKSEIAAEIISCDHNEAYLISLVENIARVPANTTWFAKEVQRMRDAGMTLLEISRIVGRSEANVSAYLGLADRGEERLIKGVEQGVFPMTFALNVAESNDAQIQHLMMDAFDQGIITSANIRNVRRIINSRLNRFPKDGRSSSSTPTARYSVSQLKHDIAKICKEKEAFVREAGIKEGRVISLVEGIQTLLADQEFKSLLESEHLDEMPKLHSMSPI